MIKNESMEMQNTYELWVCQIEKPEQFKLHSLELYNTNEETHQIIKYKKSTKNIILINDWQ